ncbi:MAG: TIM barrel protein [Firmicutes bacterium]|nr:TIM barrel protein [Bacillota bacterium]
MADTLSLAGMNLHYFRYPLETFFDSMERLNIANIELWGGYPHLDVNSVSVKEVGTIYKSIKRHGLNVICFTPEQCMYPINLASKNEHIRKQSMEYFVKSMAIAAELNTDQLLVTSGWGYFSEGRAEPWERCRQSLEFLVRQAERRGIHLLLEPLTSWESNVVTDLKALSAMLEQIRSPYLKGIIDTAPLALSDDSIEDYMNVLGANLAHVHFVDGDMRCSSHLACGDGVYPLESYYKEFCRAGYQGYLTLELTSQQYIKQPEAALKRSIETIKSWAV